MSCKKCNGKMLMQYEDIVCANCGWRETPLSVNFLLSIEISRGHIKHYDLTSSVDRKTVTKWLKRCVGSGKLPRYIKEGYIRCIVCNKELQSTPSGKTPKHLPSKWLAGKIIKLLQIKNYKMQKGTHND